VRWRHLILKSLIESLGRLFSDIRAYQKNDDKTIYLEFGNFEKEYIVFFPIGFPQTNLTILDKTENKVINNVNWEFNGEILESSLNYIKSSLTKKNPSFLRIINLNK
jgi:hypothetical protein